MHYYIKQIAMKKSIPTILPMLIIFLFSVLFTGCSTVNKLTEVPPYRAENGFINDKNNNVVYTYGMGFIKDMKSNVVYTYDLGFINDTNGKLKYTYDLGFVTDKKGKVICTYPYKK